MNLKHNNNPNWRHQFNSYIIKHKSNKHQHNTGEMPLHRKRTIRSKFTHKRSGTRRRSHKYRVGSLGGSPKTEVKCFDCRFSSASLRLPDETSPPVFSEFGVASFLGFTCINEVLASSAFYNRIGSKISIKSIQLDVDLFGAVPATTSGTVRVMIIYDRQTNGSAPTYSDLMSAAPSAVVCFSTGLNMTNRSRFSIIRDKYVELDFGMAVTQHVHMYCKGRWDVEYKATAGAIGDIATGAIYVLMMQNLGPGSTNIGVQDCISRIRYLD